MIRFCSTTIKAIYVVFGKLNNNCFLIRFSVPATVRSDFHPDQRSERHLYLWCATHWIRALGVDRSGRWQRNELAFVAWTRETGVVPAAVAGVLVAQGVPNQDELLTVVGLAVIVTLVVQATTKAWLAKRLNLYEPAEPVLDPIP